MNSIPKEALQTYTTLLKYSQLALKKQINFRNVVLSSDTHIHEIYTLNNNQKQLPHLVLLHGFAGSAMSYIRTFHTLSKYFNVHALDHFGNGFSSGKDFNSDTIPQQIVNLYVNSIEEWRKNIGLEKIVLAGHSFGGYLAASYMLQHQINVQRLILLSPVGTSTQQQIHEEVQNRKSQSVKNKIMINLIQKIYNFNIQPSKIFSTPIIGNLLVSQFLKSTIDLQKEEKQMWKQYIKHISNQQNHFEKSFYQCFKWPFVSQMSSISQILEKITKKQRKKSIQFYYGENDWTQKVAAIKLNQKYENINFQIIPNATHNMIFDYPFEVADRIISGPSNYRIQLARV